MCRSAEGTDFKPDPVVEETVSCNPGAYFIEHYSIECLLRWVCSVLQDSLGNEGHDMGTCWLCYLNGRVMHCGELKYATGHAIKSKHGQSHPLCCRTCNSFQLDLLFHPNFILKCGLRDLPFFHYPVILIWEGCLSNSEKCYFYFLRNMYFSPFR